MLMDLTLKFSFSFCVQVTLAGKQPLASHTQCYVKNVELIVSLYLIYPNLFQKYTFKDYHPHSIYKASNPLSDAKAVRIVYCTGSANWGFKSYKMSWGRAATLNRSNDTLFLPATGMSFQMVGVSLVLKVRLMSQGSGSFAESTGREEMFNPGIRMSMCPELRHHSVFEVLYFVDRWQMTPWQTACTENN